LGLQLVHEPTVLGDVHEQPLAQLEHGAHVPLDVRAARLVEVPQLLHTAAFVVEL
jgi:hypothetical protein